MIVKPGLVREMVAMIDRRLDESIQKESGSFFIRDNSFSEDRCDTTADMELELQYMALELSPYVSMDRASQIIEDIQRLSPTSSGDSSEPAKSSFVYKACLVFVIAVLLFICFQEDLEISA